MEEQPTEGPAEQPIGGSDERPPIFKNVNGWIAGVTGAVIALGGLATAVKQFMPDKPAEKQAATEVPAKPAPAEEQAAAGGEAEAEEPSYYDIDEGGTLRFVDGLWIETTSEGKFRYEHVSSDGVKSVAVDRAGGVNGEDVWLRWDTAGGQAQKSFDRQATWFDVFNVNVPEEPAA